MYSILTFLIVGTLWTVNCEQHSLTYIYTAFSKPIDLPGIHVFTAMGLLDGRMIDYYDSSLKKKIPMQPWMEEKLDKDYWDKGTQSRQSKEQWFKVNLGILRDRMRHSNDTDLHILQWRHGCTAENRAGDDKSLKFISGKDEYSYDGDDFLFFDDVNKRWIAPNPLALPTKRKWDEVKMLNDYTQGYLERECVNWLSKFVGYEEEDISFKNKPPVLHVYAKKSRNPTSIILHCLATDFFPKEVTLNIRRNGKVVDRLDGMSTTGVRPNGDGTYQIMNRVEILRSDSAKYSCEVIHPATNTRKNQDWVPVATDDSGLWIGVGVGVGVGVLLGLLVAAVIYCVKKRQGLAEEGLGDDEMKNLNGLAEEGSLGDEMKNLNAGKSETSSNSSDSGLAGERDLEEVDTEKKWKGSSESSRDSAQGSISSTPESTSLLYKERKDDEMKNLNARKSETSSNSSDSAQGSISSTPESTSLLGGNAE